MISGQEFSKILADQGVDFYTGVPDSLLKDFCGYVADQSKDQHVLAANEGNAVGIAAGYHLSTGKMAVVYLQNSGLGNTINPLTSLASPDVYGIPMVLMIGWRGEPGRPDEPQHVNQGRITKGLLDVLDIPYETIDESTTNVAELLASLVALAEANRRPVALVVSSGTFEKYSYSKEPDIGELSREEAVSIVARFTSGADDLVLSTTGKLSRELYEDRKRNGGGERDFYNVGAMGHLSQIALGIALMQPNRRVYCFDGDGAAIMHLGGLAIAANSGAVNFFYLLFNNGAHDSVGGQCTIAGAMDFERIAMGMGFREFVKVRTVSELSVACGQLGNKRGPFFMEIMVKKGARSDLGRPKERPSENKDNFMREVAAMENL